MADKKYEALENKYKALEIKYNKLHEENIELRASRDQHIKDQARLLVEVGCVRDVLKSIYGQCKRFDWLVDYFNKDEVPSNDA